MKRGTRSAGVIVLIGLAVTAAFASMIGEERSVARAARIEADIERRSQRIEEGLDRAGSLVEQLASMIAGHAVLPPEAFQIYAADTLLREPVVSALSWNPRVPPAERATFEAEARGMLGPEFRIWEHPGRDAHPVRDAFVVRSIEPLERNADALGFDIASEAERRRTLERCIDTMELSTTAPLELIQYPGIPSFLALFPIYDPAARVGSSRERRAASLGVVVGVFRSPELFDRSLGRESADFDIRIIDESPVGTETIHVLRADESDPLSLAGPPITDRRLEWGGRQWRFEYYPRPEYLASVGTGSAAATWLIGGLLSLVLAFVYSITTARARLSVEQEVLRRDEERFRLTLGVISDGWWDWDLSSGNLTLSPSWLRAFGRDAVPPEKGLEMLEAWVHPDDAAARRRALVEHRRGQSTEFSLELRIAHADGRYRWVLERGSVVTTDAEGVPVRMVAAIQEITLQKLMEIERTAMEEKLRETQRLESLGLIASGVAHDFNNWLTTIRNNVSIAREAEKHCHEVHEALSEIESATLQASGLTSQLLDYSGKGTVSPQGIDLGNLALEMRDLLRTVVGRGVTIEVVTAAEPVTLVGDPTQIAQVLMNLIVNAADAMAGEGTVRVSVEALDVPRPLPTASNSGNRLPPGRYSTLVVSDSGSGMTPEVRARIFEPFFTTKETGRGLGLAGVQGILRRHEGTIAVESQPASGTTFRVYLPYTRELPPAELKNGTSNGVKEPPDPPASRRVLIVDDEDGVRESLARLLTSRGHEVSTAETGQGGIERLEQETRPFDLVILDMTMPGIDGLEAFRAMREIQPELPGLIISGYAAEEVGELPEGLIGYFQKPFRTEQLLAAVGGVGRATEAS